MGSDFKSARDSSSKCIISDFSVLRYKEEIFFEKKDFSGKRDLSREKFKNNLNSFLNFPTKYLILLIFIFGDSNILYNSKPNLKEYFL